MPRFLKGEDDAPEGYTTLANVFSRLVLDVPDAELQRFLLEHVEMERNPLGVPLLWKGRPICHCSSHELVYAATWAVCARVSQPAVPMSGDGVENRTKRLIEPRSPQSRWEPCNAYLNLSDGRIGSGCDAEGRPRPKEVVEADYPGRTGRPVLLPAREVTEALEVLGLSDAIAGLDLTENGEQALEGAAERSRPSGRPKVGREAARAVLIELNPDGNRPSWGEIETALIDRGCKVHLKTIQRAWEEAFPIRQK
jgi:hypothetical protein